MRVGFVIVTTLAALIAAAPAHALEPLPACDIETDSPRELLTQGSPKAGLIAQLGVLRRPRMTGDVLPDLGVGIGLDRVHLRYVRRTPGEIGADQHYVVTGNYPRVARRPPAECLRGLDRRTRRRVFTLWERIRRQPTDALCLLEYQGDGTRLRDVCVIDPVRSLRRGVVVGPDRVRGRLTQIAGIVPDGVATVEARYDTGPPRTATVVDNVWALTDLRRADRLEPESLVWIDAAGAPIRSFDFDEVAFRR